MTVVQVPKFFSETTFNPYLVAKAVRGEGIREWIEQLNYLNGFTLPTIAANHFPLLQTVAAVSSGDVIFQYQKSKGAQYVGIEIELRQPIASTAVHSVYFDVAIPSGSFWVRGENSLLNTGVSSSLRELVLPSTSSATRETFIEILDVSTCVSTSVLAFTASFTALDGAASASLGHGFARINMFEIPRGKLLNFSGDPGCDDQWARPGNFLYDYRTDTNHKSGVKRVVQDLDSARFDVRSQFNISTIKDSGLNWAFEAVENGGTSSSFVYGLNSDALGISDRKFYLRANDLYGSSVTTTPWKIAVAYECAHDTVATYALYLKYRAAGAVSWSTKTMNLTTGAGMLYYESTVNLPTTGTDQVVECYLLGGAFDVVGTSLYLWNFWMAEDNA